ncbi:MAG: hypothetical protein AAGG09_06770 [Pseudomonadota bacterium]
MRRRAARGVAWSLSRAALWSGVLLAASLPAVAQEPVLRMEFPETETVPGQPLSLRLTVLVPTFLPDPPVWPSFEAPNLAVRIASTGPTSEQIDGATWAGVSRRYTLSPMVPGTFALPAQTVTVTWADPDGAAPRRTELSTDPQSLTGVIPPGAETLDPFLAADGLELSQSIEGETEGIAPGASVLRTVTAEIRGTPPMFLPTLLPPHQIEGLRAYPDAPVLEETENRGVLSGTRTERVTLVAEGGGAGEAPAIAVQWYNLQSGAVETASVEAVAISVDGPPAATLAPEPRDWRAIAAMSVALLFALAVFTFAWQRLLPPVRRWRARRRAAWAASEAQAYRTLQRVVKQRDFAAFYAALDTWAMRFDGADPRQNPGLDAALTSLGAARYGFEMADLGTGWRALARVLPEVRNAARASPGLSRLPPLNPGASPPA